MAAEASGPVAVLKGGVSGEREVSLRSGAAVEAALRERGYPVVALDVGPDIAARLSQLQPSAVFNALHGRFGEDGSIQGLLELLQISYTHSGVLASALGMHKVRAKAVFTQAGLCCPQGWVLPAATLLKTPPLPPPYVVKPPGDGSSVDVCLVRDAADLAPVRALAAKRPMLVEPYIPGREIQVAVLDGVALGAVEIRSDRAFYDYEAKYTAGKAEHLVPAPLSPEAYARVLRLAERAHQALGCRGLTRSDFRYDDTTAEADRFYLLELNTQPGMTALSLAPEIAAHHGLAFADLVEHMLRGATTDRSEADGNEAPQ